MTYFDCSEDIMQIVYLEADVNYTIYHFFNGKKIILPTTLKRHEAKENLRHFLRVHRSFLLNPDYIIGMRKEGKKVSIQMVNGKEVLVSRRKKPIIKHLKKQQFLIA
ncbi:LytR/AlgR family response regulator transcription factor [Emticicia agri]|uniref:LytTR family transcriptional regulator n=1 Tax=Emticicia agri TaxID=2492393 RepID=A0A4Q5LUU7_9BACT|nr:LytTR family DNA-binding domain-containing protein [Emticicia agri]RYU93412.1 LytTR family transcriptional regulator [Emticicia agri]